MQETVLITGGAGYIGSHTGWLMAQHGYQVILLDDLRHKQPYDYSWAHCIRGDIGNAQLLKTIFSYYPIHAVIHCAASAQVGYSMRDPLSFYENNIVATLRLLEVMIAHHVTTFIFSSSSAVYGIPTTPLLTEDHSTHPINPYGTSKLVIEMMLKELYHAHGLNAIILRYFNAAGALHEQGLGEYHSPETHLIPLIFDAVLDKKLFTLFGTHYPTPDGTCIRDYVHVMDIAHAHLAALRFAHTTSGTHIFNIGTGHGTSVLEIIKEAEAVTNTPLAIEYADNRIGDPSHLVADISKAHNILHWRPTYTLQQIMSSAYLSRLRDKHFSHQKMHLKRTALKDDPF